MYCVKTICHLQGETLTDDNIARLKDCVGSDIDDFSGVENLYKTIVHDSSTHEYDFENYPASKGEAT
jgi:hypothetical protein